MLEEKCAYCGDLTDLPFECNYCKDPFVLNTDFQKIIDVLSLPRLGPKDLANEK